MKIRFLYGSIKDKFSGILVIGFDQHISAKLQISLKNQTWKKRCWCIVPPDFNSNVQHPYIKGSLINEFGHLKTEGTLSGNQIRCPPYIKEFSLLDTFVVEKSLNETNLDVFKDKALVTNKDGQFPIPLTQLNIIRKALKYQIVQPGTEFSKESINKFKLLKSKKVHVSKIGSNILSTLKMFIKNDQLSLALYDISLLTGRSHQIRLLFSSSGLPILGDFQYYNANPPYLREPCYSIALNSYFISFQHPETKEEIELLSGYNADKELWSYL